MNDGTSLLPLRKINKTNSRLPFPVQFADHTSNLLIVNTLNDVKAAITGERY
jgi:hypothetical protein